MGRRGRCAYLLPCGGAAVTSRGRDLRRRRWRRGGGGGGSGSLGEEGASFRKGWDLPACRAVAWGPCCEASQRGLSSPGLRFYHPSGPLIVTRGYSRVWMVKPLLSKAFVDAFAWRSSPNKRRTESGILRLVVIYS